MLSNWNRIQKTKPNLNLIQITKNEIKFESNSNSKLKQNLKIKPILNLKILKN